MLIDTHPVQYINCALTHNTIQQKVCAYISINTLIVNIRAYYPTIMGIACLALLRLAPDRSTLLSLCKLCRVKVGMCWLCHLAVEHPQPSPMFRSLIGAWHQGCCRQVQQPSCPCQMLQQLAPSGQRYFTMQQCLHFPLLAHRCYKLLSMGIEPAESQSLSISVSNACLLCWVQGMTGPLKVIVSPICDLKLSDAKPIVTFCQNCSLSGCPTAAFF